MKTFLYVALGCVLISCSQAASTENKLNIVVVEGAPTNVSDKGKTLIRTNIDRYFNGKDRKKDYDILVLPEYGLTGRTDNKTLAVKVSIDQEDIKYLNELAKSKTATIVASLLEKDGDDLYSTTIVLDGGSTITKYRKTNLNETETNLKSENKIVTFIHSPSKKTIGLLSGDDILYDEPANTLVNENNVSTIIYTSSMRSIAPFKTAISLHAGFAKAHGVNLIVASLNDPVNGTSGSGIYQPCAVKSFITATAGQTSTVSDTIDLEPNTTCEKPKSTFRFGKKMGTETPLSKLLTYDYNLQYEVINTNVSKIEICQGGFCCQFNISSGNWNQTESYRLAVGENQRVCGLLSCKDTDKQIRSCGKIDTTTATKFTEISITTKDGGSFVPYILHNDLQPGSDLNGIIFTASDKGTSFTIANATDVIAIGIVGAKSGASSLQFLATSVIAISVLLKHLL